MPQKVIVSRMTGRLLTIIRAIFEVKSLLIFDHATCCKRDLVYQIVVSSGVGVSDFAVNDVGKFSEVQIVTVSNDTEVDYMFTC